MTAQTDELGQVDLGQDMEELLNLDDLDMEASKSAPWAQKQPEPSISAPVPTTISGPASSAPLPPANLNVNAHGVVDGDLDLSEFDLEGGQGKMGGGSGYDQVGGDQSIPNPFGNAWFWSIEYYQPFFDLTTEDVFRRLKMVADAQGEQDFFADLGHRPSDMYGPVWVSITFCLAFCIADSFHSWWNHNPSIPNANTGVVAEWEMELAHIWRPIYICCFLVVGLPGVWYLVGVPRPLRLVSLQGYGLAPFVPAALVCGLPLSILRWAGVGLAVFVSGQFAFKNLQREIRSNLEAQHQQIAAGAAVLSYAVVCLLFYWAFGLF